MNPIREHLQQQTLDKVKISDWNDHISSKLTDDFVSTFDVMRTVRLTLQCHYEGICDPADNEAAERLKRSAIRSLEHEFYGFLHKDLIELHYMISGHAPRMQCLEKISDILNKIGL
jgi:hypothetical protein